jgi:DNA repair protein RAD5
MMIRLGTGEKCIVFSQWNTMLDLVERALDDDNIRSVRLDGSLSQQARVNALEEFRSNPDIRVLVMSLKAGGVGLNLSAASHVVRGGIWSLSCYTRHVELVSLGA